MPELPEIVCRARQMNEELVGKTISSIQVQQPKCLNVSVEMFRNALDGASIREVTNHGKWLFVDTTKGYLLLNLGMGGEILLVSKDNLPQKWRVRFDVADGKSLVINFWWFGYAHYVRPGELTKHKMTAKLGSNALDVSLVELGGLLEGRRARVKSFLLDQKAIAGIGNAYVHDILFRAKLHPLRTIPTLDPGDIKRLYQAIQIELRRSIDKGAAFYELDLQGKRGGFSEDDLLIAYREGKPCPVCGTAIEKIKTGSTKSFICSSCQPLES